MKSALEVISDVQVTAVHSTYNSEDELGDKNAQKIIDALKAAGFNIIRTRVIKDPEPPFKVGDPVRDNAELGGRVLKVVDDEFLFVKWNNEFATWVKINQVRRAK